MSKRSPRLQFSDEEKAAPELKKAIQKAEKQSDKLDKSEAKIPKKTVQKKQFVVDADGKVTKHLHFEEVDKKAPPSKLSHAVKAAPVDTVLATARREIQESEDENVGVEGAHSLEQTAESGVRIIASAHHSHQLKPYRAAAQAEAKADKANINVLNKEARYQNPELSSNPYSRWQQKRAIKKEYMATKACHATSGTIKASETTAKATKKAAQETKKTTQFIARHKKGFRLSVLISRPQNIVSACDSN